MIKRLAIALSLLLLAGAGVVSLLVLTGQWSAPRALQIIAGPGGKLAPPAALAESFPTGQPRRIDVDADDPLLDGLTAREQADQARDWLLWTIAHDGVRSAEQLSRTLFDVPAIRHGYLRQVARFEYGRTRSCLTESGDVLALVPRAEAAQRADDLAHIADAQRKNLGRTPGKIHVFEYELDGLKSATITRLESLPGAKLFSAEYGYRENDVTTAEELADFMRETDDLLSVKVAGRGIRLGGRKSRTGYRNVRPIEVAAVWQAEEDIQERLKARKAQVDEFNAEWHRKLNAFNSTWEYRKATPSNKREYEQQWAMFKRLHDLATEAFEKEAACREQGAAPRQRLGLFPRSQLRLRRARHRLVRVRQRLWRVWRCAPG